VKLLEKEQLMSTIANPSVSSLPAAPAEVADAGKIRTGLGFKVLPATVRIAG
jgi:hypothetical protein